MQTTQLTDPVCFTEVPVDIMRRTIANVRFDLLPRRQVLSVIENWRAASRRGYITLTNPHSVMMCHRDPEMRLATQQSGLTLADGVGIIVAAKVLGFGRHRRVTGPNLMLDICDRGRESGLRHYLYGGLPGIAERLAQRLERTYPGIEIVGTMSPPFRDLSISEDEEIAEQINAAMPDIIWVGLGAPKQEKWMARQSGRVEATAMIGVGAAFDFHSGNMKWAPTWMRNIGLEWFYRLGCEPRRMWRRNLDSPRFVCQVLKQAFSQGTIPNRLPGAAERLLPPKAEQEVRG
ncbi:MAG: WecB/TagA/CpsF family glycosyltransferase [Pirellulaceae bacterium]|nr:WecB/TagA/CpsF family glycosyltransferase [Planctomycetales bacterium]